MIITVEVGDGAVFDFSLVPVGLDDAEAGVGTGLLFSDEHVTTINVIV